MKPLPAQYPTGQSKQRNKLSCILGQAAIAGLTMTEQVFEGMERVLYFCLDARPRMLQLSRLAPQFVLGRSLALGALHGDVPRHSFADVLQAGFQALVTGCAQRSSFVTVQQRVRLRDIGDIASCADDGVHQASCINTNMCAFMPSAIHCLSSTDAFSVSARRTRFDKKKPRSYDRGGFLEFSWNSLNNWVVPPTGIEPVSHA